MAGHSQFKNIMHRKGAQDAKRAKVFTKLIREIITAARHGQADINFNPRLRAAIIAARAKNMPKDKIDNAIKRGAGAEGSDNFDEMRYEGYGPGGVAVIVDALTDNRNRTASEVRSSFTKHGGSLGESGSVGFMFDHVGQIEYAIATASAEAMFEAALEAGAEDCSAIPEAHIITTTLDDLHGVRDALAEKFGEAASAGFVWKPKNTVPVSLEQAESLLKMIELLEDSDDVQTVTTNVELSDEIVGKLG